MNTYKVLSNLRHDGSVYKKGDEIEISKDLGDKLVADGVLADINAKDEDDQVPLAPRTKKAGKGEKKETKTTKKDKEDKKKEDEDDQVPQKKEEEDGDDL